MGTGWRRAFCTSIPRDPPDQSTTTTPSPRSRLSLFNLHSTTSSSNPSTPRNPPPPTSEPTTPTLRCNTTTTTAPTSNTPPPSSPRSPSTFALFKNTLRLSRSSSCGICSQSVKALLGTAIYIAECSHAFHFHCITTHVRNHHTMSCPVCAAAWRQVPRFSYEADEDETPAGGWRAAVERVRARKEQEEKKCASAQAKAYDDDEPLLSPCGSRFIPIPENDDEDCCVDVHVAQANLPGGVELSISPEVALLSSSRGHDSYVVSLKAKAVPSDPRRRALVDLVVVLDTGGTMSAAKFHVLKRALRLVVGSLSSGDRLSIVAFSSAAKRQLPLRRMSPQGQRAASRIVDRLVRTDTGTATAAAEALRKANRILEDRRERNAVSGVVILSDAQQQHHLNKLPEPPRYPSSLSCWASSTVSSGRTRFAHVEIPITTVADLPEDTLANCVSGLLSVVAQDVRMEISLPSGEIAAFYSLKGQPPATGSLPSISIGDLYAEEEREIMMEIKIPAVTGESSTTLTAKCSYRDPTTQELISVDPRRLNLSTPRHRRPANDSKTEALKTVYIATRAISESRHLVEVNELPTAVQLLSSARAILQRSTSASVEESLRAVEVELAEVQRRREQRRRDVVAGPIAEELEGLTPTSAWRAAERLAKVAMTRKSLNRRVSDLHGFEDARF